MNWLLIDLNTSSPRFCPSSLALWRGTSSLLGSPWRSTSTQTYEVNSTTVLMTRGIMTLPLICPASRSIYISSIPREILTLSLLSVWYLQHILLVLFVSTIWCIEYLISELNFWWRLFYSAIYTQYASLLTKLVNLINQVRWVLWQLHPGEVH